MILRLLVFDHDDYSRLDELEVACSQDVVASLWGGERYVVLNIHPVEKGRVLMAYKLDVRPYERRKEFTMACIRLLVQKMSTFWYFRSRSRAVSKLLTTLIAS